MWWYIWKYPDSGGGWVDLGWFKAVWDPSRKDWTDITAPLYAQTPPGESAWWYAMSDPRQPTLPPREGRYEPASDGRRVILEGRPA